MADKPNQTKAITRAGDDKKNEPSETKKGDELLNVLAVFVGKVNPILTFLVTLGALLSGFYVWVTADFVRKGDIKYVVKETIDFLQHSVFLEYCLAHDHGEDGSIYANHWKDLEDYRLAITGKSNAIPFDLECKSQQQKKP